MGDKQRPMDVNQQRKQRLLAIEAKRRKLSEIKAKNQSLSEKLCAALPNDQKLQSVRNEVIGPSQNLKISALEGDAEWAEARYEDDVQLMPLVDDLQDGKWSKIEDGSLILGAAEEQGTLKKCQQVAIRLVDPEESKSQVQLEEFKGFIKRTVGVLDRALFLGGRYDLFDGQYDPLEWEPRIKRPSHGDGVVHTLTCLDQKVSQMSYQMNDMDWNPFDSNKVLSACNDQKGGSGSVLLEWNLDYEGRIESRLTDPCSRITKAKYWSYADTAYNFSKGSGNLVVGGSDAGKIVFWDTRTISSTPIVIVSNACSSMDRPNISPHLYPITDIQMIDDRHFASVDTFGVLAVWDIYNLERPIEQLNLVWMRGRPKGIPTAQSDVRHEVPVSCIGFRDDNAFCIGSSEGVLYSGQRHGDCTGLQNKYHGHEAMISSIKFHPKVNTYMPKRYRTCLEVEKRKESELEQMHVFGYNVNDLVLTASWDWSVSLWDVKLSDQPLATFCNFDDYVTDISWSNHHPAMFVAVDSSGVLSVWNLNSDGCQREAEFVNTYASPNALNKVIWSPHQPDLIVASSYEAQLQVYKVDKEVAVPSADEWHVLERKLCEQHRRKREHVWNGNGVSRNGHEMTI